MVDQLLGGLFGAQDDDDDERRQGRARDFVSRYEQGPPTEGYSMEEAVQNYRQVSKQLSPEDYQEAATEAFSRMSPQERRQFADMMRQQGGGDDASVTDDPRDLARVTSRFRQQTEGSGSAGGLGSLFGGGGGGIDDLFGSQRGGGRTSASSGGGGGAFDLGDLMGNPLAKAALGGIAAMAMKKMFR